MNFWIMKKEEKWIKKGKLKSANFLHRASSASFGVPSHAHQATKGATAMPFHAPWRIFHDTSNLLPPILTHTLLISQLA